MTQHEKILKVLQSGKRLTTAKAVTMGIVGPAARISELRAEGHSIFTNHSKKDGYSYKLGKPSREMVRIAYAVAGQDVFGGR